LVGIRGWFRQAGDKSGQPEYTIDDLIVLERYEEAAERLREKLKGHAEDLHSHLKLAEVYAQLGQLDRSIDEFGYVADEYAQDGFYDKGIALLSKASKLAPLNASLRTRIETLQSEKSLEHVRSLAIEGLRQAGGEEAGTSALELQRLWHNLAGTAIVQRLPGEQVKRLFSLMRLQRVPVDGVVATEASQDAALLLIVRGVVTASIVDGNGRPAMVRNFTAGDIIGESALFERGAWPATYRVTEAATILKLDRDGLEKSMIGNSDPRAFLELLREQRNDRDVANTARQIRGTGA
jgi:hypothetical protein